MFDRGTAQVVAGVTLLGLIAGAAVVGQSIPRSRHTVIEAREPARGTEGLWLLGNGISQLWGVGVLLLPMWFYAWPSVGDFAGSAEIQVVGLVLWALGGGLVFWSTRTLGGFMTVRIEVTDGHRLVQEGPYAWVRHPTYTAAVASAAGLAMAFLSPPLLALALLLAALARYRAGLEEGLLRSPRAFGTSYDAYMARTGRFLPRLRRAGP